MAKGKGGGEAPDEKPDDSAKEKKKVVASGITKESILEDTDLYKKYKVRCYFPGPVDGQNGRLLGGTPKHPDLLRAWLQTKGHSKDEKKAMDDMGLSNEEQQDVEKKQWCGFRFSDTGVFIEGRQIKACLKTGAVNLGFGDNRKGYRQVIDHGFVIEPDHVYLQRENGNGTLSPIKEPDGTEERVQHISDARGKRSCLTKYDYVDDCFIEFEIQVLSRKKRGAKEELLLGLKQIKQMLYHGERDGLGACRSQSFGRFNVVAFEEV